MTTFETGTDLGGIITAAADADATTPKPLAANDETTALSVDDLKQLCSDYGCSKSGNKAQLVEKIMNPGEHQIKKGKKRALEIEAVPVDEKPPLGEGLAQPDFTPVPDDVQDAQPDDPTVGAPVAAELPADDDVEEEPEA